MPDPKPPVYPSMPPAPAPKPPEPPKRFDNPNQDPNHPANITQPRDMRPGAERDRIEGAVYSRENMMTEQEKAAVAKGGGDSARTPYPTGDPPPPSEVTIRGQGIKGGPDQPAAKPDEAKKPVK
jgi:hypothetical protein